MRATPIASLFAGFLTATAVALPPPAHDAQSLLRAGEPVPSIGGADAIRSFEPLDNEHVMLGNDSDERYLVTLSRQCAALRWAQHVGVTASGNTIWAGFDTVTADGEHCQIREIRRLPNDLKFNGEP
jgi:hypothetical protein